MRAAPYAGSRWLSRALKGPVFAAPAQDARSGRSAMISAAPVPGGGGVVAAFGDLTVVAPKLVALYGGGDQMEFLVTNADGTVVARTIDPGRWVGVSTAPTAFAHSAGKVERPDLDGTVRLYASAPVPGLPWRFYAGVNKASALASDSFMLMPRISAICLRLSLSSSIWSANSAASMSSSFSNNE
jgi:hypothetical protein